MLRFDTLTTGTTSTKVTFALDGKPVLTKKKPPFSVELDLGSLPRTAPLTRDRLRRRRHASWRATRCCSTPPATASGPPGRAAAGQAATRAACSPQAEVEVPDGEAVERVEFFLNETRVATLYQPPYAQPIVLPKDEPLAYVRAVAYLTDGNSTEDLVFVNAPDYLEEIDVEFVELYTSVLDRQGRPVEGLGREGLHGRPRTASSRRSSRFERVDRPARSTPPWLLDVSASMEDEPRASAQAAALRFLEQTIQPKDRAAIVTFNDRRTWP